MKQINLFNTVNQTNEFSQRLRYRDKMSVLNSLEKKIIYFLVSLIEPEDQAFYPIVLAYNDFCQVLSLNERGGKQRQLIKDSLQKLRTTGFWVKLKDGKSESFTTWLEESVIMESGTNNKRIVILRLSKWLRPFFLALKESARTIFQLGYILNLKKKHSCDIYALCKSVCGMKHYYMPMEELYDFFGGVYSRYNDVVKYILDPSVEEINKFTDITIQYDSIKKGPRRTHIIFHVKEKSIAEKASLGIDDWKKSDNAKKIEEIAGKMSARQDIPFGHFVLSEAELTQIQQNDNDFRNTIARVSLNGVD